MIQANLIDFYYIKLCKIIKISSSIEGINTRHFLDLLIDTKDYIRLFNRHEVPKNLYLTVMRDMHDQITTRPPSNQKTIIFITWNYYWLGLKKMVQCYIQNCHSCRCTKAPRDQYNVLLKLLPIFFCP